MYSTYSARKKVYRQYVIDSYQLLCFCTYNKISSLIIILLQVAKANNVTIDIDPSIHRKRDRMLLNLTTARPRNGISRKRIR